MAEQGALLKLMIESEILQKKDLRYVISNDLHINPREIKISPDEICFITFIKINATSDFIFNIRSASENRTIEKTVTTAFTYENNIITRHPGSVKFEMSNTDQYEVSSVIIKFIK